LADEMIWFLWLSIAMHSVDTNYKPVYSCLSDFKRFEEFF
jgi:hypothetical protein